MSSEARWEEESYCTREATALFDVIYVRKSNTDQCVNIESPPSNLIPYVSSFPSFLLLSKIRTHVFYAKNVSRVMFGEIRLPHRAAGIIMIRTIRSVIILIVFYLFMTEECRILLANVRHFVQWVFSTPKQAIINLPVRRMEVLPQT